MSDDPRSVLDTLVHGIERLDRRLEAVEQSMYERPSRDPEVLAAATQALIEHVAGLGGELERRFGSLFSAFDDVERRLLALETQGEGTANRDVALAEMVTVLKEQLDAAAVDQANRFNKFVAALNADRRVREDWEGELSSTIAAFEASVTSSTERSGAAVRQSVDEQLTGLQQRVEAMSTRFGAIEQLTQDAGRATATYLERQLTDTLAAAGGSLERTVEGGLAPLRERLAELTATVAALAAVEPPAPPPPPPPDPRIDEVRGAVRDLASGLGRLQADVTALAAVEPPPPPPPTPPDPRIDDLAAALDRVGETVDALAAVEPAPPPPPPPPDPRIDALRDQIGQVAASVEALAAVEPPAPPPPPPPDPRIDALRRELAGLRAEMNEAPDRLRQAVKPTLEAQLKTLESLDERIRDNAATEWQDAVQAELALLREVVAKSLDQPPPPPPPAEPVVVDVDPFRREIQAFRAELVAVLHDMARDFEAMRASSAGRAQIAAMAADTASLPALQEELSRLRTAFEQMRALLG